jgi:hypothetical protein
MSNSTDTNRNAVFVAARAQGRSLQTVVDAIKACKLDWANKDQVASIADAYKAGRVAASLDCKTEKAALAILSLKPYKDGAGDGHRTLTQHNACRVAIATWSQIRLLAGAPSAQDGTKRKARPSKVAEKDKSKDKAQLPEALLPALTRWESAADMNTFALRIARLIKKNVNMNAALVKGDVGDLLRRFPVDMARAMKVKDVTPAEAT